MLLWFRTLFNVFVETSCQKLRLLRCLCCCCVAGVCDEVGAWLIDFVLFSMCFNGVLLCFRTLFNLVVEIGCQELHLMCCCDRAGLVMGLGLG